MVAQSGWPEIREPWDLLFENGDADDLAEVLTDLEKAMRGPGRATRHTDGWMDGFAQWHGTAVLAFHDHPARRAAVRIVDARAPTTSGTGSRTGSVG